MSGNNSGCAYVVGLLLFLFVCIYWILPILAEVTFGPAGFAIAVIVIFGGTFLILRDIAHRK